MPDGLALALALVALAGALGAAVAQPRYLPEALVAGAGALLLVAVGAIGASAAGDTLRDLGPTDRLPGGAAGARGGVPARGAVRGRRRSDGPRRAGQARAACWRSSFAAAAVITAVLSLDATVVLLTPVVFATAARMRTSPTPHVYACSHLANSASLLLPVSNLTNLLAFHASGLSFARFGALMALPTVAAVGVEWAVISRFFAIDLRRPRHDEARPPRPHLPRFALAVVGLTLAGFALSSLLGIEPVWVAAAGAAAISVPALAARRRGARRWAWRAPPSPGSWSSCSGSG